MAAVAEQGIDVLLVEDNASDAELAMRVVRRTQDGCRILHIEDGARALDWVFGPDGLVHAAGRRPPRLVLLDLKLPKVNGLEVLERLKSDPRTRAVPVVVLSSSKEERDVVAALDRGANSYVVKPVSFDEYTAALTLVARYWLTLSLPPTQPIGG